MPQASGQALRRRNVGAAPATPAPNHHHIAAGATGLELGRSLRLLQFSPSIALASIVPTSLTNGEYPTLDPTVSVSTIGATPAVIGARIGPTEVPTDRFVAVAVQCHSASRVACKTWLTTGS